MVLEGIVDAVREATGTMPDYPDKRFLSGFAPPDPSLFAEQERANKAGERPGKQYNLAKVCPILMISGDTAEHHFRADTH